jgi:hypothetical protein
MPGREQPDQSVSTDVQDIVREILSAVRAVKLYPSNNPVYSQAIAKSFKNLDRYLQGAPELRVGVRKTTFLHGEAPLSKDGHLHAGAAGDLFARGIREMAFTSGVTLAELRDFYTLIALSPEEYKRQGGMETLLWNKGISHILIKEAALEEVLRGTYEQEEKTTGSEQNEQQKENLNERLKNKEIHVYGKKVMLADLASDPASFGNLALEMSHQEGQTPDMQDDQLLAVYREVGRQVLEISYEQRKPLFQALASSILSIDAAFQERLISNRLYPELDRQSLQEHLTDENASQDLHEIVSSRFSSSWTVPEVSALLEKVSSAKPGDQSGANTTVPLSPDLPVIVRELSEYTSEEMEELKALCESCQEEDVLVSTVATLIHILPLIQSSLPSQDDSVTRFSRVVDILENMFIWLLEKKDYSMALLVLRSFQMPVEPAFRSCLTGAVKKAGDKNNIIGLIHALRALPRGSADAQAVISCLILLDRDATPVLLEMLAEEEDRSFRKLLIQILRDLGKNQIAFLGERLSDGRWYFVRNIVNILGESRKEEAVEYLQQVANHKNFQIRQEVVRALMSIGGKKAADLLVRFLNDSDVDIRFMAVRGLGDLTISGTKTEQALMNFLQGGLVRGGGPELKYEAIQTLGKIGGPEAVRFLVKFARVRWWKARKPQEELSAVTQKAIREIERRSGNAGRSESRA